MTDAYIVEPDIDPADIKPNTKVVIDLHPAAFKNISVHDSDPLVRDMKQAVADAYTSMSDFSDRLAAAKSDPLNSPLLAEIKVAGYVDKRANEIGKSLAHLSGRATRQIEALAAKMSKPVAAPEDPAKMAIHGEIRAHIKAMRKTERYGFVRNAMTSGDVDTAVAALSGPAYLAGLTAAERTALEGEYRKVMFPDEAAQLARLTAAVEQIDRMQGIYTREIGKVVDWAAVEKAKPRTGRAA